MKKLNVVWYVCLTMFSLAMFSCQQLPEDDDWLSEEVKLLEVKVRSVEEGEITYPVHLYAFAENGTLAASQTITDTETEISLPLSKGNFQIVALSGISDSYLLPENPDLDDVVTLSVLQGAETPLMMGRANVEISDASKALAQITLSYMVSALNVELKNIPGNVSSVQLSLSPLYSTLSMNGEYGGTSQNIKVDCTLASEGMWTSNTAYIFPGSGTETVFSICFKMDDGKEVTFGYIFRGIPEANHLFNVMGTYADEGVIVGGSFDATDWEGAINVEFEFGANVIPDDEEEDGCSDVELEGIPEVGGIWNGMIVADIKDIDETEMELLLMTLDEWDATTSQVPDVISGYSVNGISDWRLPTHEEAALLRSRFSGEGRRELNELIAQYDSKLYGLANGQKERYLCLKNGELYSFQFIAGTKTTEAGDVRIYYVRLVKTYKWKKS